MTTVVITGANRGLGLALAKHYIAQGATVIGGCRTPATADELNEACAEVHQLDTSSGESIAAFGDAVGDRPVDLHSAASDSFTGSYTSKARFEDGPDRTSSSRIGSRRLREGQRSMRRLSSANVNAIRTSTVTRRTIPAADPPTT